MSKKSTAISKSKQTQLQTQPQPRQVAYWAAAASLLIAAITSCMLVYAHLDPNALPGCGAGSPCSDVADSWWGMIRLFDLDWPISMVGAAFFIAMLIGWIVSRQSVATPLRWFARVGAVVSIVYLIAIVVNGHWCQYCIATHIANLTFVGLAERVSVVRLKRPVGALLVPPSFAIVLTIFLVRNHSLQTDREDELGERVAEAVERAGWPADRTFTGRYRMGPEQARVRIVVYSDYQCGLCQQFEPYAKQLVEQRSDVSVSAKHFPYCRDCNYRVRELTDRNPNIRDHKKACWAARVVEAAGKLGGERAFWGMHEWLFQEAAQVTDRDAMNKVRTLGVDPQEFFELTKSNEMLKLIEADVDEALELGVNKTPAVYVNGVELKGWRTMADVRQAIEQIIAAAPPAQTAAIDRPPLAREKVVIDWQEQPVRRLPADDIEHTIGPEEASVHVVVWGDYQERFTIVADKIIRQAMADRGDVRYTFRHYPFNQSCNPVVTRTAHEHACRAAQAAEVAGILGGEDAYWEMHRWLIENSEDIGDGPLLAQVDRMGLDGATFQRTMPSARVSGAIREDSAKGKGLGLNGVPYIHINNKRVTRWRIADDHRLRELIDVAAQEAAEAANKDAAGE